MKKIQICSDVHILGMDQLILSHDKVGQMGCEIHESDDKDSLIQELTLGETCVEAGERFPKLEDQLFAGPSL